MRAPSCSLCLLWPGEVHFGVENGEARHRWLTRLCSVHDGFKAAVVLRMAQVLPDKAADAGYRHIVLPDLITEEPI